MNKIEFINWSIWGGLGFLLYVMSIVYVVKVFKWTKGKFVITSLGFLSLLILSFFSLYHHYGISMMTVVRFFLIYNLTILSLHDLVEKHLPLEWLIFTGVFGILFLGMNRNINMFETGLSTLLFGGGMLFLARITRGGIGHGDAVVMALITLILGWKMSITVLLVSFFLIGCLGLGLLLLKKVHKKNTLPFVPFVLFVILILEVL